MKWNVELIGYMTEEKKEPIDLKRNFKLDEGKQPSENQSKSAIRTHFIWFDGTMTG